MTNVKLLLDMKREGRELSQEDIRALVASYTAGDVPDYQMASFAMAVCCRGMTKAEIFALTDAMRLSGKNISWEDSSLPVADKHSTGGVGDKLSFLIQPIAASCGVAVPSLAGRGLGLTGGTIDKLEAIPGYDVSLSVERFKEVVFKCGVSISTQTAEIAPADKKLYALRDVTGTVSSIPLITASILSKKLAGGAGTLVFDVKCGSGAFMREKPDALNLAKSLVESSREAGRKASALVTSMDEPLGFTVGNALEVWESIEILKSGKGSRDIVDVSIELAAMMVANAKDISIEDAQQECKQNFENGKAYSVFKEMISLHGGDIDAFLSTYGNGGIAASAKTLAVKAPRKGYISHIDAMKVAQASLDLGAGREKADDKIDLSAGVKFLLKRGAPVNEGDTILFAVTSTREDKLEFVRTILEDAIHISDEMPSEKLLILERVI